MIIRKSAHEIEKMADGGPPRRRDDRARRRAARAGHHDRRAGRIAEEFIRAARRRAHVARATAATRPRSASRRTTMVVHGIPGAYAVARGRRGHDRRRRHAGRVHRRQRVHLRRRRDHRAGAARCSTSAARRSRSGSPRRVPATASATSRRRCSATSRRRGSRSSAASSGTASAAPTTRIRTSRTSASPGRGPLLSEGMTIAIEPMITAGGPDVYVHDDEWSISTEDGSLSRPLRAHRRDHRRGPADPDGCRRSRGVFATIGDFARLCRALPRAAFSAAKPPATERSMAVKEEKIEVEGEVVEALPSTMFRVQLDDGAQRARHDLREDAQALHPHRCPATASRSSSLPMT